MKLDRRFGFAAFIAGVVVLGIAYFFAQAEDEVINGFTGRYMLGAIGMMTCGGILALLSNRR